MTRLWYIRNGSKVIYEKFEWIRTMLYKYVLPLERLRTIRCMVLHIYSTANYRIFDWGQSRAAYPDNGSLLQFSNFAKERRTMVFLKTWISSLLLQAVAQLLFYIHPLRLVISNITSFTTRNFISFLIKIKITANKYNRKNHKLF